MFLRLHVLLRLTYYMSCVFLSSFSVTNKGYSSNFFPSSFNEVGIFPTPSQLPVPDIIDIPTNPYTCTAHVKADDTEDLLRKNDSFYNCTLLLSGVYTIEDGITLILHNKLKALHYLAKPESGVCASVKSTQNPPGIEVVDVTSGECNKPTAKIVFSDDRSSIYISDYGGIEGIEINPGNQFFQNPLVYLSTAAETSKVYTEMSLGTLEPSTSWKTHTKQAGRDSKNKSQRREQNVSRTDRELGIDAARANYDKGARSGRTNYFSAAAGGDGDDPRKWENDRIKKLIELLNKLICSKTKTSEKPQLEQKFMSIYTTLGSQSQNLFKKDYQGQISSLQPEFRRKL